MIDSQSFTTTYNGTSNVLNNEIEVFPAFALNNPPPNLQSVKCNAVWDTGASRSVITPPIAAALKLVPTGRGRTATAGGLVDCDTYIINLTLPTKVTIQGVQVNCLAIPGSNAEFLIGMDVINLGDFAVTSVNGMTKFTFRIPGVLDLDFFKADTKFKQLMKKGGRKGKGTQTCPCGSGQRYLKCHGKKNAN